MVNQDQYACPHVLFNGVSMGVKRFTGVATQAEFLCNTCARQSKYEAHHISSSEITTLEANCSWTIEGAPAILHAPRPFIFTRRELYFDALADVTSYTFVPLNNNPSEAIVFTSNGQLLRIDIHTATTTLIAEYPNEFIHRQGRVSIKISQDNQLIAITSCVTADYDESTTCNTGIIIESTSGTVLMQLQCGDYYTEQADFPVAFITHHGKTLAVHATDWNRLDVTDPYTGQCLTSRDFATIPKEKEGEKFCSTEWSGELIVSPNQHRIATIGWMWHPIGIAFSWCIQPWLEDNPWEADIGPSKAAYVIWSYFWQSPFFWLNDEQLCIWGYETLSTEQDIPLPSATIYDAASKKLLHWFAGPTMDVFYYDQYLFSGNKEGDGITVWDIDAGTLLHEEKGIKANKYHPGSKEFVTFSSNGNLIFHHWREAL